MPFNNKELLKDVKRNPIPQQFDPVADEYKPLTKMEYFGSSTETKPTTAEKGATYFEFDTKTAYIFTGSTWVVL